MKKAAPDEAAFSLAGQINGCAVCPPRALQRDAWVLWRPVGENARHHRRGVAGRCAESESDPGAGLSPLLSVCQQMHRVYPHELLAYLHEPLACLPLSAHWGDWR